MQNIAQTIDGLDWRYDADQAHSLRCFATHKESNVLHYQEMDVSVARPFELAFSNDSLLKLLVEHGHARPLMLDSTFGTNNLKVRFKISDPKSEFWWNAYAEIIILIIRSLASLAFNRSAASLNHSELGGSAHHIKRSTYSKP